MRVKKWLLATKASKLAMKFHGKHIFTDKMAEQATDLACEVPEEILIDTIDSLEIAIKEGHKDLSVVIQENSVFVHSK